MHGTYTYTACLQLARRSKQQEGRSEGMLRAAREGGDFLQQPECRHVAILHRALPELDSGTAASCKVRLKGSSHHPPQPYKGASWLGMFDIFAHQPRNEGIARKCACSGTMTMRRSREGERERERAREPTKLERGEEELIDTKILHSLPWRVMGRVGAALSTNTRPH